MWNSIDIAWILLDRIRQDSKDKMIKISTRRNEFFPYVLYTLMCIIDLIEIVLAVKRGVWWAEEIWEWEFAWLGHIFVTLFNNY